MCRRGIRGFTLVEMAVASAITAVLVGVAGMIYVYSTERTAFAIANNSALAQVRDLSKYLENSIQNATSCLLVLNGSNSSLRCIMPASGVAPTDSYGVYSAYTPTSVSGSSVHWGTGNYRWFYMSDSSGAFINTHGSIPTMAETTGSSLPSGSNSIPAWTYYYGGTSVNRWNLIDGLSFTVNTSSDTVTYTISASDLVFANAPLNGSTNTSQSRQYSLTRTVYWRHSTT